MNMPMDHSDHDSDNKQDPNTCCKNITEHLQVDDDVQLKKLDIKLDINFTVALIQVFIFGTDANFIEVQTVPYYLSPPPAQDLHVLYESFLI